jgi:hypothetical protein
MRTDLRDVIRPDEEGWLVCPEHGRLPFRPAGDYDVDVLLTEHALLCHGGGEEDERELKRLRKRGCVVYSVREAS